MTSTKKTGTLAKSIAIACYPEYRGRKIRVEVREAYGMSNYWEGGSRNYAVAYDLRTGTVQQASQETTSPFSYEGREAVQVAIPAGVAVVEHAIFCGKDIGITIYVNPSADKVGLIAE